MGPLFASTGSFTERGDKMDGDLSHEDDRRSRGERRRLPRSTSIYKWNFDPSGNWWEERRSGGDRRKLDVAVQLSP